MFSVFNLESFEITFEQKLLISLSQNFIEFRKINQNLTQKCYLDQISLCSCQIFVEK